MKKWIDCCLHVIAKLTSLYQSLHIILFCLCRVSRDAYYTTCVYVWVSPSPSSVELNKKHLLCSLLLHVITTQMITIISFFYASPTPRSYLFLDGHNLTMAILRSTAAITQIAPFLDRQSLTHSACNVKKLKAWLLHFNNQLNFYELSEWLFFNTVLMKKSKQEH